MPLGVQEKPRHADLRKLGEAHGQTLRVNWEHSKHRPFEVRPRIQWRERCGGASCTCTSHVQERKRNKLRGSSRPASPHLLVLSPYERISESLAHRALAQKESKNRHFPKRYKTVCVCEAHGRAEKSEVEDRHVKEVTDAFALIQVIDVVVISRRRGEAEQGSKHCGKRSPGLVTKLRTPTPIQELPMGAELRSHEEATSQQQSLSLLQISLAIRKRQALLVPLSHWRDSENGVCVPNTLCPREDEGESAAARLSAG